MVSVRKLSEKIRYVYHVTDYKGDDCEAVMYV